MIHEMEEECAKDREAALADMRFKFIEKVCTQTVVKPTESKAHARSVKADKILTGKYTALPAFAAIPSIDNTLSGFKLFHLLCQRFIYIFWDRHFK